MTRTVAQICRQSSSLSDVQIHILQNSEPLLQFASDLSQRRLSLFVPARKEGALVLAALKKPLFDRGEEGDFADSVGACVTSGEEPVVAQVMAGKDSLTALKEVDYGRTEPMVAYPFVDTGGKTIAVITFTGEVAADKRILTETAFSALQVPSAGGLPGLYKRLSVQDGVILVDSTGKITYADDMAENIMRFRGRTAPLCGETIYSGRLDLAAARHALVTRQGAIEEINRPRASLTMRVIPLLRGGKLFRLVLIMTERTEIRRKEEELLVKQSVIKEIHHRVKNNLQTVAGLLRMQMRRVATEEAKAALQESLNRILSISLVHETLSLHDGERIDASAMAKRLLGLLTRSLTGADLKVITAFDGASLYLSSREAVSVALVLNELITNSLSHGFAGLKAGVLTVTLTAADGNCTITVADTGRGLGAGGGNGEKQSHLGLDIVRTIAEKDLHGAFRIGPNEPNGTVATLTFPLIKE